jgi:hypothetical protein
MAAGIDIGGLDVGRLCRLARPLGAPTRCRRAAELTEPSAPWPLAARAQQAEFP